MAKKHAHKDSDEAAPQVLTVKATSSAGAMVKLPTSDEAVLFPMGRTELDGLVVVVTP